MRNKLVCSLSLIAILLILVFTSVAQSQCVTSSDTGSCPSSGAYAASSSITESNGYNTYVHNNVTGGYGVSPVTQTLTSNSPESWSVSADFGASTHQMSYPNTDQNYNGEAVSSFTNIVGTFNETTPHNSNTEEAVGFFIYLNNYGNSIEIQHDMVNTSQCGGTSPVATNISFGGSYGVPAESWDLCYSGSFYYWQLPAGGESTWGESSGSVDLISMIKYLENNGYLPSNSTMTSVEYGFMIYTTTSTQETFTLNSYSLINNASSSSPTISLSPTSLSFSATAGGANPAAKNVTVSNSGGGTLAPPTTSISYNGGSGWLSVNCTGSSSSYTCSTQPSTGSLTAGTYNATVKVFSSGASNSPQSYTVAFTVNPVSSPAISLSPTSLSFTATAGGANPAAQNVTVSNSGGGTLASPTTSISYNSGSGWLSVNCTGNSSSYTCSTQPSTGSLTAGTYNATVKVFSSGASNSPQSYTVAFTVNSGSICETTTANGSCGPYSDAALSSTFETFTQNDVWNPPSSWTQHMYTTSPSDWYIEANFPTDSSGAIHSYPSAMINYYDGTEPTIDSYSYMYSSFASTPDTSSTTVMDSGFDIWLNNWAQEVMIQTQLVNTPACTTWMTVLATNVSFGGSNGVPTATWNLCRNGGSGSEIVWQYTAPSGSRNFGQSSSSVDIYHMLKYLESHGYIASGSTFTQTCYGFEISTTGGLTKNFSVTNWTQTASH